VEISPSTPRKSQGDGVEGNSLSKLLFGGQYERTFGLDLAEIDTLGLIALSEDEHVGYGKKKRFVSSLEEKANLVWLEHRSKTKIHLHRRHPPGIAKLSFKRS
jgi:hypothetical protein